MSIFYYKGRDNDGRAVSGSRMAQSSESLSILLIKEGVIPITIKSTDESRNLWQKLNDQFETPVTRDEMGVFSRQMYSKIWKRGKIWQLLCKITQKFLHLL
jgi:MSHA biogenesis protein MshG